MSPQAAEGAEVLPFVTVVMPLRNEGNFLARSLGSVLTQDYPSDRIEVLALDGRSTDGTREALEAMARQHPRLSILDNPAGIVAPGLNAALRQARGEIVVRVDGHCEIAPEYVRRCVEHLRAGEAEGVGGPIETVGESFAARVIAGAMSSAFGVGGAAFRTRKGATMFADTVAFPAYTREALERAGPFDEELVRNQDDEYNYRLRELGGRILLAADVRARYYARGSLRLLARQYFQYGYWKVRVMQKHPAQMKPRQFVPPLFVGALATGLLLAPFSRWATAFLVLAVGAYAAANATASLRTSRSLGLRSLVLLPAVYATLHLSYGLGFLKGLLRFWNRWGDRRTRFAQTVEGTVEVAK